MIMMIAWRKQSSFRLFSPPNDTLQICETENSGVRWFSPEEALRVCSEPWFVRRIYSKLNEKLAFFT